jgi:hypothetical protein
MTLVLEQKPDEKKSIKYFDSKEQISLSQKERSSGEDFSGDHPYRRRRL